MAQDSVFIEGLKCQVHIGVTDQERAKAQSVVLDLKLKTSLKEAGEQDQMSHAVDYARACTLAKQLVEKSTYQLVEALAESVAAVLLKEFAIQSVEVKVRKFSVPEADAVGVQIERSI